MSGGQVIPLLEDILYPNEKECFCTKYRMGFVRIGEAVRGLHPKSKAIVLSAIRQSGFTKEDLRELNWTFSSHLWNVGNFALPGRYSLIQRRSFGIDSFSDRAGIQTEDHSYPPGMMTYSTHSSSTTTTTMPPVPAPRTLHQSTTTSTTHSRTVKTTTMRRGLGGGGGGRAETGGRRVRRRRKGRGRSKNKSNLIRPGSGKMFSAQYTKFFMVSLSSGMFEIQSCPLYLFRNIPVLLNYVLYYQMTMTKMTSKMIAAMRLTDPWTVPTDRARTAYPTAKMYKTESS